MKRKLFFMGALTVVMTGAIFWSCQKDEVLMNAEDGVMLKKGKVAAMETSEIIVDTLYWTEDVCAGSDFTLTVEGVGQKQIRMWNGEEWIQLASSGNGEEPLIYTIQSIGAGTYYFGYKIGNNFTPSPSSPKEEGKMVIIQSCGECTEWQTESAFAGEENVNINEKGSWFYIFEDGDTPLKIWAGQTIEVGTAEFANGNLNLELTDGWELQDVDDAIKIFGFDEKPTSRPNPGQNKEELLYQGDELTIDNIDDYNYYVIHLDVRKCIN